MAPHVIQASVVGQRIFSSIGVKDCCRESSASSCCGILQFRPSIPTGLGLSYPCTHCLLLQRADGYVLLWIAGGISTQRALLNGATCSVNCALTNRIILFFCALSSRLLLAGLSRMSMHKPWQSNTLGESMV